VNARLHLLTAVLLFILSTECIKWIRNVEVMLWVCLFTRPHVVWNPFNGKKSNLFFDICTTRAKLILTRLGPLYMEPKYNFIRFREDPLTWARRKRFSWPITPKFSQGSGATRF
jgi:hypothetical protein